MTDIERAHAAVVEAAIALRDDWIAMHVTPLQDREPESAAYALRQAIEAYERYRITGVYEPPSSS